MKKLIFNYGAMNSSKSMHLLQVRHNYISNGRSVAVLTSSLDDRHGVGYVKSRALDEKIEAIAINDENYEQVLFNLDIQTLHKRRADVIFVDESQFLSSKIIDALFELSNDITVICYGLRTAFDGSLFEGSARLLALADEINEIPTLCSCCRSERKARFNMRLHNGVPTFSGEQVLIGDAEYIPVCKKCFIEQRTIHGS